MLKSQLCIKAHHEEKLHVKDEKALASIRTVRAEGDLSDETWLNRWM